jgi:tetratricopeptide (TPR) repeat protein
MTMSSRAKPLAFLVLLLGAALAASCARHAVTAAPEDIIKTGWYEYSLGEFDRAVANFQHAVDTSPKEGDRYLQGLFGLATTWNLRRPGEDPETARELYNEILATAPTSDVAAWSQLALARMKHLVPVGEDPDYDEVRKAYQEVMDKYPDHLAAKEAFIYYNATLISTLDPDDAREAIASLEKFVADPKTVFLGPAYSLLAVANTTLGNQEKRLEMEIKSLDSTEIDPTNPFTEFSWQYWNIATIAEFEVGDFDTARAYYRKLMDTYPQDIKVFACRKALERMDQVERKLREEM